MCLCSGGVTGSHGQGLSRVLVRIGVRKVLTRWSLPPAFVIGSLAVIGYLRVR